MSGELSKSSRKSSSPPGMAGLPNGGRLDALVRSDGAAARHARLAVLGLHDLELDAAVLFPGDRVGRVVDRAPLAVALGNHAVRGDAATAERVHHGRGSRLRELQVVLVARALVGVAGDLD